MKVWSAVLLLAASACASPRYLARVNGHEVRGDEALRVFGRQHVALEKALSDEKDIRKLLDRVVDRRLFLQEAQRLGLHDAPDVVEATTRYEGDLLAALVRQREIDEKATTSEADVLAAHALLDRVYVVRQLVVPSRSAAEALRAKVVAGADLEELVRQESVGPASRRGGMLMVQWGGDDEAREKAVLSLGDAGLSEVFRSSDGWEFVRIERRVEAKTPELEAVRTEIERVLRGRVLRAREAALREELWARYEARIEPCAAPVARATDSLPELCAAWTGGGLGAADVGAQVDRKGLAAMPQEVAAEALERHVRDLATRELMALEGRARGWAALPEIADKVRFKHENLVEEKLYAEYVFRDLSVTDEEVKAYHESRPEEFVRAETFELAHIAVASGDAAAEVAKDLAAGAIFEDLAQARSLDKASAARGGYVGVFTAEQLTPPLDRVLQLEVGAVTEPFALGDGHHVVKLVRKHPKRQLSFEDAAAEAKERLLRERATQRYDKWAATLRGTSKIQVSGRGIRAFSAERLAAIEKEEQEQQAAAARKAKVASPVGAKEEAAAPGPAEPAVTGAGMPVAPRAAPAAGAGPEGAAK